MTEDKIPDRDRIRSSVVRLGGIFKDPARAHESYLSTAFVVERGDGEDEAWLITNAHCVCDEFSHVEILSYDDGKVQCLGTLAIDRFARLSRHRQDLAVAVVNLPDVVRRAFPWIMPPAESEIAIGTEIFSYGYPDDGTIFESIKGPAFASGVTTSGLIRYPTYGLNFHVDGRWGPGRSGSPMFSIHEGQCVLCGINKGNLSLKADDGSWVETGWTRAVSVDHLPELFGRAASGERLV